MTKISSMRALGCSYSGYLLAWHSPSHCLACELYARSRLGYTPLGARRLCRSLRASHARCADFLGPDRAFDKMGTIVMNALAFVGRRRRGVPSARAAFNAASRHSVVLVYLRFTLFTVASLRHSQPLECANVGAQIQAPHRAMGRPCGNPAELSIRRIGRSGKL